LCGGAAVYRRTALDDVGLFDADFGAFCEDTDWALRAQLAGFDCRYVPSAVVFHMGSATLGAGLTDFTRYRLWRNTVWMLVKGMPASVALRHGHRLLRGAG
jgi:GT2 family glycosyltransferase